MLVVVGDFTNAIYDIRSSAAGKPPLANSAPAQVRAEAGKPPLANRAPARVRAEVKQRPLH